MCLIQTFILLGKNNKTYVILFFLSTNPVKRPKQTMHKCFPQYYSHINAVIVVDFLKRKCCFLAQLDTVLLNRSFSVQVSNMFWGKIASRRITPIWFVLMIIMMKEHVTKHNRVAHCCTWDEMKTWYMKCDKKTMTSVHKVRSWFISIFFNEYWDMRLLTSASRKATFSSRSLMTRSLSWMTVREFCSCILQHTNKHKQTMWGALEKHISLFQQEQMQHHLFMTSEFCFTPLPQINNALCVCLRKI